MAGWLVYVVAGTPIVLGWALQWRLSKYLREDVPGSLFARGLRPDQFTDDGQHLLRWLWLVVALTIPWVVAVGVIFGFP